MAGVRLQAQFAAEGRRHGGDLYLPLDAARRLVASCGEAGVAVIAVEICRWPAGVAAPQVEQTGDFSDIDDTDWSRFQERCTSAAEQLLAPLKPHAELWICFVLLDRASWEPELPA